jgi:cytochrome b6-f complex iron-sulfur subunit
MPDITLDESSAAAPDPKASPEEVSRRGFIARAGLGAVGVCYAGAVAYPVYRYLAAPAQQAAELAAVTEVKIPEEKMPAPGGALMFRFGSRPTMLIHHKDGTMVCLTAVCTHLGCTVQYQPEQEHIHCACHGGVYDARTGANISGPPPKPLQRFNVERANGEILITRV